MKPKSEYCTLSSGTYLRRPIQTPFVNPGDDLTQIIKSYAVPLYQEEGFVAISSKIVTLCQNGIIPKSQIHISPLARFLSSFASESDTGIGVHCVYKMQYAIDECGAFKVIFASVMGGVGKLFHRKGVFYDIVGDKVRCLDGFYPDVFPVYGEYGIPMPQNSTLVCEKLFADTGVPCAIVDANDFTCDVFGKCGNIPFSTQEICMLLKDNPAGQDSACTPLILITRKSSEESQSS